MELERPPCPRRRSHLRRCWRAYGLAAAALALLACQTLPDTQRELSNPPAAPVEFETANGPVSQARSEAIIEHLQAGGDSDLLERHLAYEQQINADQPLVLGNELTLLQNGPATYESMFAAIREAKHDINLETYIFDDDEIGEEFSALLLARQAAGVQVNVIFDSVGSIRTPRAFFDRMRAGGIRVIEYNPVNPLKNAKSALKVNNRDHRRQLVVDGRIAFTGGVNISDTYSSAPSDVGSRGHDDPETGWRDTHIRIEGPVVADFQKLFMESWSRQNGPPLEDRDYFPDLKRAGDGIVRVIGSTSDDAESGIYLTLISALKHAEERIHLTVAYFAPDPQLLQALIDAARRGTDVKLVLPSVSDSGAIFHLGRSYYTELLEGGVHIYERRGSVMHAKTACIDGVWSTIGSTNLDWRSFLHNDEINAVILGRDFAAQMEAMFSADLAESDEILLEQWKRRPWALRVKERMARLGAYWM
jgi:cardiolipin synthase